MAQLIQRAPLGLLSLLDSKAGGIAPNVLTDTVAPTVELMPLYGLGTRQARSLTLAAAGVVVGFNLTGSGNGIIPPGECWHLINLTCVTANVIAAGVDWATGYSNTGSFFQMIGSPVATATAERGAAGGECDVWLPPGTQLGVWVERTAAGADFNNFAYFERYTL